MCIYYCYMQVNIHYTSRCNYRVIKEFCKVAKCRLGLTISDCVL